MTVRELVITFGFEVDESSIQAMENRIRSVTQTFSDTLNGINDAASQAFGEIGNQVSGAADEIRNMGDSASSALENIGSEASNAADEIQGMRESQEQTNETLGESEENYSRIQQFINNIREQYPQIGQAAEKVKGFVAKAKEMQEKFKQKIQESRKGYKGLGEQVEAVKDKVYQMKSLVMTVFGAIGLGMGLSQMNELAEEFNGINDQIRNATAGLGEQKEIQQKILQSANELRASYGDTANMVSMLVQENSELFGSVDEALAFNEATTKLFKTAGKGADQIAGLNEAINKSFAKGAVDSETISQLLEQSPEAVKLLCRQLNTTSDQLEQLASDGAISLGDLKNAFVSNSDEINKNFEGLDYSISDALLNIREQWGYWLDSMNSSIGLTNSIAKFMTRAFQGFIGFLNKAQVFTERLVKKLGGIEKVFKLIAIAGGAIFLALNAGKILSFLKGAVKMLNLANLKMLAMIAVVVLIALLVEDFINFMQGNDSVIGDVLASWGIDAEKTREKITKAWEKIKKNLLRVWNILKQVGTTVLNAFKEFWAEFGDEIVEIARIWIEGVMNFINILIQFFEGFIDIVEGIFNGDWEQVCEGFQKIFEAGLLFIQNIAQTIWDAVYAIFGAQIDKITQKVTDFVEKVKEKLNAVKEFFGGVGDFFGGIGDFFTGNNSATVKNTTVANSTGKGSKTNNVSQNVEINQTFNGTDQAAMSKAAGKAAGDTTSQLAKGLAYGH